jgi:hypothetical protein
MRIGIIGAGMIGGTLAMKLAGLGHEVAIANSRGPETLRELAAETGAHPVTATDAARSGEVVVVAIPQRAVMNLPEDPFAAVPADVVVIDTGNYYSARDGRIAAIEQGQLESAWVSEKLGRPVIKAFNNIFFKSLLEKARAKGSPERLALPVAGIRPMLARRRCAWWTSSDSIRWMQADSMSPGASSRARRATPRSWTLRD